MATYNPLLLLHPFDWSARFLQSGGAQTIARLINPFQISWPRQTSGSVTAHLVSNLRVERYIFGAYKAQSRAGGDDNGRGLDGAVMDEEWIAGWEKAKKVICERVERIIAGQEEMGEEWVGVEGEGLVDMFGDEGVGGEGFRGTGTTQGDNNNHQHHNHGATLAVPGHISGHGGVIGSGEGGGKRYSENRYLREKYPRDEPFNAVAVVNRQNELERDCGLDFFLGLPDDGFMPPDDHGGGGIGDVGVRGLGLMGCVGNLGIEKSYIDNNLLRHFENTNNNNPLSIPLHSAFLPVNNLTQPPPLYTIPFHPSHQIPITPAGYAATATTTKTATTATTTNTPHYHRHQRRRRSGGGGGGGYDLRPLNGVSSLISYHQGSGSSHSHSTGQALQDDDESQRLGGFEKKEPEPGLGMDLGLPPSDFWGMMEGQGEDQDQEEMDEEKNGTCYTRPKREAVVVGVDNDNGDDEDGSSSVVSKRKNNEKVVKLSHMCDYKDCGKSFQFRSKLDDHKLTHTSEKSIRCPNCNKRFKRTRELAAHRERVHSRSRKPSAAATVTTTTSTAPTSKDAKTSIANNNNNNKNKRPRPLSLTASPPSSPSSPPSSQSSHPRAPSSFTSPTSTRHHKVTSEAAVPMRRMQVPLERSNPVDSRPPDKGKVSVMKNRKIHVGGRGGKGGGGRGAGGYRVQMLPPAAPRGEGRGGGEGMNQRYPIPPAFIAATAEEGGDEVGEDERGGASISLSDRDRAEHEGGMVHPHQQHQNPRHPHRININRPAGAQSHSYSHSQQSHQLHQSQSQSLRRANHVNLGFGIGVGSSGGGDGGSQQQHDSLIMSPPPTMLGLELDAYSTDRARGVHIPVPSAPPGVMELESLARDYAYPIHQQQQQQHYHQPQQQRRQRQRQQHSEFYTGLPSAPPAPPPDGT